jgi:outer membrane protein OmpA-like peptidoglycan-associated protein
MKTRMHTRNKMIAFGFASALIVACSSAPLEPDAADHARSKLTQLQADPQLSTRAPVAINEAELAVRAAEETPRGTDLSTHLVFMADRKVDIAWAEAQSRLLVDERKALSEERQAARLDARTREADIARSDATSARGDAEFAESQAATARGDAEFAESQAAIARGDAEFAQGQAASARTDANTARSQAETARVDTEFAQHKTEDLQRQIAELNARATERGLVVTLGDVLFETGGSALKGGTAGDLDKLAVFLNQYPERTVVIEGHADNVGSEDSNLALSQRRADSVKSYLVSQGVGSPRLTATGKGESSPVAGNDSSTGRQQNRRVEVIISNT